MTASATASAAQNFFKVYREPLGHPMFRGHLDWLGAWILIQSAADQQDGRVTLTDVGRTVCREFGWDNDRWRRLVRRLEKEGLITVVEKKNLGDKVGHVQIALVHPRQADTTRVLAAPSPAAQVRTIISDKENPGPPRSDEGSGAVGLLREGEADEPVWVVIADGDSDESP